MRAKRPVILPEHIFKYLIDFKEYLIHDRRLVHQTAGGYLYCTERFLEFVTCDPTLVASKDIREFIKYLDGKKMRSASVAGYVCALRSFYNWMNYAHKCEPVADTNFYLNKIVRSKGDNDITQFPTDTEVERLRECLHDYKKAFSYNKEAVDYKLLIRDLAAIEIFKATGCRSGELKHVAFVDINFDDRTVLIRKAKGGRQRISIFGDTARAAVEEYVKEWEIGPEERLFFFTKFDIFYHIVKRWAVRSGINPSIHPRSFRHYHVTKAQRDGVSAQMVANQVGHVNLTTTLRYTHLDPTHRRKEYKKSDLEK